MMEKTKQLPRGVITLTWMIIAWTGGYIQARAFNGDTAPPTGPYRSVPYQSATGASQATTNTPATTGAHKSQVPPVKNAPSPQATSRWTREEWEARRKTFEDEQRQRQQAMLKQRQQFMEQQRKEMQEVQPQGNPNYPPAQWGPPAYGQAPAWAQEQWEAQRKAYAEQQQQMQQAMAEQRKAMNERQNPVPRNYPPAQWGPPQYQQGPQWRQEEWEARRKAFEQAQQNAQQTLEQRRKEMQERQQQRSEQHHQQVPPYAQDRYPNYPPQQWGPQGYGMTRGWSQPGWAAPPSGDAAAGTEDQQAMSGAEATRPAYPPMPNYYRPAPGYYPQPWGGPAAPYPPYWR
ncbi:MAG: hypothetical protein GC149_14650 [Gammaproteobacteria bacterium]|nr:hypothetical protein [Gammaproteobacteria bacterium]